MAVVLLVMFAGEVMGFAVMLVCAIFRALSSAYESLWQY
jgi:hypothetical protein